jgi:hypothetical protein
LRRARADGLHTFYATACRPDRSCSLRHETWHPLGEPAERGARRHGARTTEVFAGTLGPSMMEPLRTLDLRIRCGALVQGVTLLCLLASACSASTSIPSDLDGAVAFDGASFGKCSSNDYLIISAAECPTVSCLGSSAFALCESASYSKCACAPPGPGWTLVDGSAIDGPSKTEPEASHGDAR